MTALPRSLVPPFTGSPVTSLLRSPRGYLITTTPGGTPSARASVNGAPVYLPHGSRPQTGDFLLPSRYLMAVK